MTQFSVAFSGILATFTISFILELWTIVSATQGVPLDGSKRKYIPLLVELDAVCHVVQCAFVGYLSYLGAVQFKRPCDVGGQEWNDDAFIWSVAGVYWTYCLFYLVFALLACGDSGKLRGSNESWEKTYMNSLWISVLWFGWNPFSKKARQYHRQRAKRVGKNMKSLFGHSDMSMTDFILAFAFARHQARHSMNEVVLRGHDWANSKPCLEKAVSNREDSDFEILSSREYTRTRMVGDPVDDETLQHAEHMYKFAMAAYGWMMYMMGQGILRGIKTLFWGGKSSYFPMFRGQSNVEVACRVIDTEKENILFLREQGDKDNVLCYVISLDHDKKRVVVSVRGAVTIDDNVRDVLLEPGELDGWVDCPATSWESRPVEVKPACQSSTYIAQGDYLEASRATICDILDCGVLEETLSSSEYQNYELFFTGHSLGAACSFFMAFYFRQFIKNVTCWCFSPPLGLVDKSIAMSCESWCTTIVCGKELPPRFSAATLDLARDQLLYALATIKEPKWKLAYKLLWNYKKIYLVERCDEHGNLELDNAPEEVKARVREYLKSRNDDDHRKFLVASAQAMTIPGKVVYFQPKLEQDKNATLQKSNSVISVSFNVMAPERNYDPIFIENECMNDQGIILTGRFLADHMPDYAEEVIQRMAHKYNED